MKVEKMIAAFTNLRSWSHPIAWLRALPPTATAADAWASCDRGDWLVWLVVALHRRGLITRQTLVIVTCATARTALVHMPAGEHRPRVAIETAERWARGGASADEVLAARADARAAGAFAADAIALAADAAAFAAHAAANTYVAATEGAAWSARAAAVYAVRAENAEAFGAGAVGYDGGVVDDDGGGDVEADARRRAEIAVAVRSVVPWSTIETSINSLTAAAT